MIAPDQPAPSGIAVDDRYIYWSNFGEPSIRRAPRAGGPAVEIAHTKDEELGGRSLVLAGDWLYFDNGFDIYRVAKTGGPIIPLGHSPQLPLALTADADAAYFAADTIGSLAPGGQTRVLAHDAETFGIAVDATHVYWVGADGVKRVPKVGGAVEQLAGGRYRFARIAVTDRDVYWGDALLGGILTVPKAGGKIRYIAHCWNLATDALVPDHDVLWVMQSDGQLERVDPVRGVVTSVAFGVKRGGVAEHTMGIAAAGDTIYVATGGGNPRRAGPQVVDLTVPNPTFPKIDYDGEILSVPAAPGPDALVDDDSAAEITMAWFDGATDHPSDEASWVRRLDDLPDGVRGAVVAGKLGLHVTAFTSDKATAAIAQARAAHVVDSLHAKLGGAVKLAATTAPTHGYHGDVQVALDRDELAGVLAPTEH